MTDYPKTLTNALYALKRGFRVNDDGELIGLGGKPRKLDIGTNGYPRFSVKNLETKKSLTVQVHTMVAVYKFGIKAVHEAECVRHLDDNRMNFRPDNIAIGTLRQNAMDAPYKVRAEKAARGGRAKEIQRNVVLRIKRDRAKGLTYNQLQEKYGISRGALVDRLNK